MGLGMKDGKQIGVKARKYFLNVLDWIARSQKNTAPCTG